MIDTHTLTTAAVPAAAPRRCAECQKILIDESGPRCGRCQTHGIDRLNSILDLRRLVDEQAATIERLEAEIAAWQVKFANIDRICGEMAKAVSE